MPMTVSLAGLLAAFLLHLGPALAGLAGHGIGMVAVFALLNGAWSFLIHRGDWPLRLQHLRRPGVSGLTALKIGILIALPALLMGAGGGLGALAGWRPGLPVLAPPGISVLGLALGLWAGRRQAEIEVFLDRALAELRAMPAPPGDDPGGGHAAARAMAERIAALSEDIDDAALTAMMAEVDEVASLFSALDTAAGLPVAPRSGTARRALILLATDETAARALVWRRVPAVALDAAGDDPALLRLVAGRLLALVRAAPDLSPDFPMSWDVDVAAHGCPDPATAALLRALRDALNALAPDEPDAGPEDTGAVPSCEKG